MKEDGGAVGLTESPAALQRWMVSGPEMAHLTNEFEASRNQGENIPDLRHHEQRPGVQKTFLQDVIALKAALDDYGNPFLESSGDLLVLDTRDIADEFVTESIYKIEDLGNQQYQTFVEERLVERKRTSDETIKKIPFDCSVHQLYARRPKHKKL